MASKNSGFTSKNGRGSIKNSGLTSQVMQFFGSKLHEAKIWGPRFMSPGPEWCCRFFTPIYCWLNHHFCCFLRCSWKSISPSYLRTFQVNPQPFVVQIPHVLQKNSIVLVKKKHVERVNSPVWLVKLTILVLIKFW